MEKPIRRYPDKELNDAMNKIHDYVKIKAGEDYLKAEPGKVFNNDEFEKWFF